MIDTKIMRRRSNIVGWLLAIPTVMGILMFIVYPIVYSTILSFTNYRFINKNVIFVGFENYVWLFRGGEGAAPFWRGLMLSAIYTFVQSIFQTVLGFFFAYMLYSMGRRVQAVYKVLIYLPVILPMAVVTVMFKFFLEPQGVVNIVLERVFDVKDPPLWLNTNGLTMFVVILINTWRFTGITTIIYFVAMNNVDVSILESARLDGAGKGRILSQMLLPLTWASTKINLILSLVGGLKSYDFFLVLTDGMGDTQVVGLYIYRTAFEYRTYARAVTMSLVLTAIIGIMAFAVNFFAKRGEKTE